MQVATIEETVNSMVDEAGGQLKAIQEFLFTIMADVRMPLIDGIKFSSCPSASIQYPIDAKSDKNIQLDTDGFLTDFEEYHSGF